ncbi:MAG: hypothetical protein ACOC1G_06700 [Phycisphaeraceae bacterium]
MLLRTVLNRVHPVKGFVYEKVRLIEAPRQPTGLRLDVQVRSRHGSRGYGSGCGRRGRTYDHLDERRFDFVPLWGIAVVLIYAMRRIDCPRCGVTVEWVAWAERGSKCHATLALQGLLARWARRLSWQEVAECSR